MKREMVVTAALLATAASYLLGQAPPAPTADRVGFPADYRTTFKKMLTFDRPDNGQIRVVWANAAAASTPYWEAYPYGSVLLFESYAAVRDASGNITLDGDGHFVPGPLTTLFVKRKERGFGEAYAQNRNGEWEYMAYRPDGTVQTAPQNTGNCAICHLQAGPAKDYTFRRDRMANAASGLVPTATMSHYRFVPGDLTVKKGTRVTWYNDDEIEHQIFSSDLGFNSDAMTQGAAYSHTFDETGTFEIRCNFHAGMRAKVTVTQ